MSSPEVSYSFLTPQSFLERSAYVFRNKHAVVYRQQRWTYPELAARVNQLASALREWGLSKSDRVAYRGFHRGFATVDLLATNRRRDQTEFQ